MDVEGEEQGGVKGNSQVPGQLGGFTELAKMRVGVEHRFDGENQVPRSEQVASDVPMGPTSGDTEETMGGTGV